MKIVFTGGGTGGHFYPIIAVAESVRELSAQKQLLEPSMYYVAPTPFDEQALFTNGITYIKSPAGKMRRYASLQNVTDLFVTAVGVFWSLVTLFRIYPDVVFSKGGYGSVPTVIAARILRIPIVIHESDAQFGLANGFTAKFAYRIATAFESASESLPAKLRSRVAVTGIPIRKAIANPALHESGEHDFGLEETIPTLLVIGGSLGSQRINEMILTGLPDLVSSMNIIHQTGKDNLKGVEATSSVILDKNPNASRYHPYAYLSQEQMREAAAAADLIVSRAGSTAITEISLWNRPAILVPIPEAVSHDQRRNAYAYARTGAAVVLEEDNMTPHVLASEIRRIISDPALSKEMADKGAKFANPKAADLIAEELLSIGISHDDART